MSMFECTSVFERMSAFMDNQCIADGQQCPSTFTDNQHIADNQQCPSMFADELCLSGLPVTVRVCGCRSQTTNA
jgi:hypothetical protein